MASKAPNGTVLPYLLATYRTPAAHDPGWPFATARKGYGKLYVGRKLWSAHRYVWVLEHGPIPSSLFVCHSCDTPGCFWIDHLWVGTNADNMADCWAKGRGSQPPICRGMDNWKYRERVLREKLAAPR